MSNFLKALGLTVVSACALFSVSWAQNLVYNGSFETPISDNRWTRHPATWFAGETFDGYWYVSQGSIDIIRTPLSGHRNAYDGSQYLDLNGTGADANGVYQGGVYQDIAINTPGLYRLSFAMNGNYNGDSDNPRTMVVSLGTLFTGNYTHTGGQPWVVHSVDINIPTAGTYRLAFTSTTYTNQYSGPGIDAVSLELVPEPASMIALGIGLAGLLSRRRRSA